MKPNLIVVVGLTLCGHHLLGGEAAQPALRIRPIQIVSSAAVPEDFPFELIPATYRPGFQIRYLIEGKDMVAVGPLVIESIKTPTGEEISKRPDGRPAYEAGEIGRMPHTSKDGKYSMFTLDAETKRFGKIESLAIKGHVTVLVASKREKRSVEVKVAEKEPARVGPFSVQLTEGGYLFGPPDLQAITISIDGPHKTISEVILKDGEKESQPERSTWPNDEYIMYYVPKPKAPRVTVTLSYWVDVKEVKVPISQ